MKTASEIEGDVYALLRSSQLRIALKGSIYRETYRPKDSQKEDAVIVFTTGLTDQIETGIVTVVIYVPDINVGNTGELMKNGPRIDELEKITSEWVKGLSTKTTGRYKFELASTIRSFSEPDLKQHYISVKLRYKHFGE